MTKLKVIELFAGIGAQREALKRAGIDHEVVAIPEIDKYTVNAHELRHGRTANLSDISKIKKLPKADMWTYSFPNTHSSLLREIRRLLEVPKEGKELPKYFLKLNITFFLKILSQLGKSVILFPYYGKIGFYIRF